MRRTKIAVLVTGLILICFISFAKFSNTHQHIVEISSQTWMRQNLGVDTFRNGDPIAEQKSHDDWENACGNHEPAWCYYNNDPKLGKTYGKLYNIWAVVDPRGLAPKGWRIPSDADWQILIKNTGGKESAGDQLKEQGNDHWKEPNEGASNKSGFTALPGGSRGSYSSGLGGFMNLGECGIFWTSTYSGHKSIDAQVKHMTYFNHRVREYGLGGLAGLSVRCVKN